MGVVSSSVVSVAISLATRAPQAANFGVPAIFCKAPFAAGTGRKYELSSEGLAAMITDGFTLTSRGYLLAASMNSQSPHTDSVLVYGRTTLTTNVLNWTPLVTTAGVVYTFDLTYKGVTSTISYTVLGSSSVDIICDAVKALINASPAGTAGVAALGDIDPGTATKLILTGGTTGEPVQISGMNPALAKVLDVSSDAGIATDLAAAALGYEFYAVVIDSYSEAENDAAAAWAEANGPRLFFAQSGDSTNILDAAGTGVGQDFFAALYSRSSVWHSGDMKGNLGACIVARQLSQNPGTSSYAFKTLAGPVADALTATHLANASGKNVNVYGLDDGTSHTFFGHAASGRSLRIQTAIDVLDVRIREAILSAFLSNEVIPMSDAGFAIQEAAVRGVLANLASQGIIDPNYTVTVPKAATVTSADKVAGILRNLKFGCTMPNDMLKVVVSGTVSF